MARKLLSIIALLLTILVTLFYVQANTAQLLSEVVLECERAERVHRCMFIQSIPCCMAVVHIASGIV